LVHGASAVHGASVVHGASGLHGVIVVHGAEIGSTVVLVSPFGRWQRRPPVFRRSRDYFCRPYPVRRNQEQFWSK
jgi:hypothetical protein